MVQAESSGRVDIAQRRPPVLPTIAKKCYWKDAIVKFSVSLAPKLLLLMNLILFFKQS